MAAKRSPRPKAKLAAAKSTAVKSAPKKIGNGSSNKITLKHIAHGLAEEHQLTKKQGEAMLNDLVAMITKHLKKGERIRITASASCRCASAPHAWVAIRPPAKRSRSRREEDCVPRVQRTEDSGLIIP